MSQPVAIPTISFAFVLAHCILFPDRSFLFCVSLSTLATRYKHTQTHENLVQTQANIPQTHGKTTASPLSLPPSPRRTDATMPTTQTEPQRMRVRAKNMDRQRKIKLMYTKYKYKCARDVWCCRLSDSRRHPRPTPPP